MNANIGLNGHIKSFKPPLGLDERSKANVGMSISKLIIIIPILFILFYL